jgi:dTDP-4-amino-4,6-dideoxygalactose transaminase
VKLNYLDEWNAARSQHAKNYNKLFVNSGVVMPEVAEFAEPVWHLFVIRVEERDALREHLWDEFKIGTGIHYPIPIHLQPAYQELGHKKGDFPITEEFADQILSLPMYAELTPGMIEYVTQAILQHNKY